MLPPAHKSLYTCIHNGLFQLHLLLPYVSVKCKEPLGKRVRDINSARMEFCWENNAVPPSLTVKNLSVNVGASGFLAETFATVRCGEEICPGPSARSKPLSPSKEKAIFPLTSQSAGFAAARRRRAEPCDSNGVTAQSHGAWAEPRQGQLPPPAAKQTRISLS